MPKRKIEVDEQESSLIMLGLSRLQGEAKKMATQADRISSKEIMDTTRKYNERLEELKNRFL